jgi:hypothetical protein
MAHPQPREFDIRKVPIPTIADDELLLKGESDVFKYLPSAADPQWTSAVSAEPT